MSYWQRAIVLMDMDAFFASVEQLDFPELRGLPIAVTNGEAGSTIITRSYEARAYGITTGMRFYEAKKICPQLIQRASRSARYAEISCKIMQVLADEISPEIEVFSIDEAFLDITHSQRLLGEPKVIGEKVRRLVYRISGCTCSVGVAANKAVAKFAAKRNKPNGLCVIEPSEAAAVLADVPVTELCGIGRGIANFLAGYGVFTCGHLAKLPVSVMAKRFGNIGRRLWLNAQGRDLEPLHTEMKLPQTLGHGKILPPHTTNREVVKSYFDRMCERVGRRLRVNQLEAQHFFIAMRIKHWGWVGGKYSVAKATNDQSLIRKLAQQMLRENWLEQTVAQVQVTALNPKPINVQGDLFAELDEKSARKNRVIDQIKDKYGGRSVVTANLVKEDELTQVISPSWRPGD